MAHLNELLQTTFTHLPPYLVKQISNRPIQGQIEGQFIKGTLLFADISGFTAMSERLSRIGREGAEEITAIVNRYFNKMLAILQKYQGQLITFGGDALLGLFEEPDSATHAVQAALDMQNSMNDFVQTKTSQGVFPLLMKVGLRRGEFYAAQLGTSQRMQYAFFGKDVNATAATESAAVAGQVLLDRISLQTLTLSHKATPLSNESPYALIEQIEFAPLTPSSSARLHPLQAPPCLKCPLLIKPGRA
jgi:class 3 adenylate cyclase